MNGYPVTDLAGLVMGLPDDAETPALKVSEIRRTFPFVVALPIEPGRFSLFVLAGIDLHAIDLAQFRFLGHRDLL
ncbi:MAG: hypothetical protein ABI353_20985 [Isosphaeraceae bacterium]